MFSKALFKQTAKANWIKWFAVTVATCVMLAIVIIVLGNLGINNIRDSLKQVFTQANQEAYLKDNAVDLYTLYVTTAETNDQMDTFAGMGYTMIENLLTNYDNEVANYELENGVAPDENTKKEIANNIASAFVETNGNMIKMFAPNTDLDELKVLLINVLLAHDKNVDLSGKELLMEGYYLTVYDNAYAIAIEEGKTDDEALNEANQAKIHAGEIVEELATVGKQTDYSDYALIYANKSMYNQVYEMQISAGASEDEAKQNAVVVKVLSNTAINTYTLWLAEGKTPEEAKIEATKSISDQIEDEKVVEALQELGNMDVYGLIIGSIFYRIAGLLLPMVFVIMVANGLLAGQVDSGSMAYVLSTPTKRRAVTTTQMAYLLYALFSMFLLVTVVSVVSVWVVGGNNFAINFGEILLFNLGAFITMFAFAGFCFMCSAIFNRTKYSLSFGGGITIFMLVCTILGLFGSDVVPSAMRIEAMNFFNYLSLITFFDTTSILAGALSYLWKFGILAGIGIVTFIIGVFCFDKKDLPL